MTRILIGNDHAGQQLKNILVCALSKKGYNITDFSSQEYNPEDDFPDIAERVCTAVRTTEETKGVLICTSGQGMTMAANKMSGIRAALCWDAAAAIQAREHLDANVLCLGTRLRFIKNYYVEDIVIAFLRTPFLKKEKYVRRINKIAELK